VTYAGGLRARLIRDSVWHTVDDALRALGWYESVASRADVVFVAEPVPQGTAIDFTTLALGDEDDVGEPAELGSGLTEFSWDMHVDVYAESDALSLHLARDVAAALAGRLPAIDRARPVIDVWDYTLATPVVIFAVAVESVRTDKANDFPQPWLRYWRSCSFVIVDTYDSGIA
jgi:hypothetical protein